MYSRTSGSIVRSLRNAIWLNQQRCPVTGWRTTALRRCQVRRVPSGCHSNSVALARQYRSTSPRSAVPNACSTDAPKSSL